MPRLLVVSTLAGTIDMFLLPFAKHFRGLGWRVDALAKVPARHARVLDYFDAVHDVQWSRNPLNPANLVHAVPKVRRCVAEGDYDLVHVHTPVASFVTRFALRGRRDGKPQVVYTAHGFHFHPGGKLLSNAAFVGLEYVAGRWTDHLVVMNRDDHQAARRYHLVRPDRLVYMPGIGVDTSYYSARRASADESDRLRRELGVGTGRYVLVIGLLEPRKRPLDALAAFNRVARRFPDLHLVFAGTGPLEGVVRSTARTSGVAERVHIVGFRSDVPPMLRSAAALLLPSEREGLPRCVLEAMACGVPCVASDVRGTRDLLEEGCGLPFELGNTAQAADALSCVLSDPDVAQQLVAAASEKVKQFGIEHVISLHERLYDEALGNARRGTDRAA